METTKRSRTIPVGDAAVEGLLSGILAGIVMAAFVIGVEILTGAALPEVLGYFDASSSASPIVGLFTHVAVSGIYGVVFAVAAVLAARLAGGRMSLGVWLVLGAVYGVLIFAIAEWIILPRTDSPLREVPAWAFGLAHVLYGVVLAWLTRRNK